MLPPQGQPSKSETKSPVRPLSEWEAYHNHWGFAFSEKAIKCFYGLCIGVFGFAFSEKA
jgi:hypothetical protein